MFALTVKNGNTRIYLTEGTAAGGGIRPTRSPPNFWRTDNGQPAGGDAARVAAAVPVGRLHRAGPGDAHVPRDVQRRLAVPDVADDSANPYFTTTTSARGAVLVRPARSTRRPGMPDTVYVIGCQPVRRAAVRHEGRRLRKRSLERPRGALLEHRGRSRRPRTGHANVHRPVVRRAGSRPRRGARTQPYFDNGCVHRARTASIPTSTRSRSIRAIRPRSSRARTAA